MVGLLTSPCSGMVGLSTGRWCPASCSWRWTVTCGGSGSGRLGARTAPKMTRRLALGFIDVRLGECQLSTVEVERCRTETEF